ncbi:hypothetical protein [Streptomyces sp. BPTC-684]|uniref:hypothetical protein n=1 Tax=Streptomyces sp. BPTC-684 TaxID=3043734 RepID=UPI0024B1A102|nr:hypothetical protein [Streptomyces sp. BPTC-684]WHM38759.1 hypothetical protein QIY60_18795 [Streptomyces sp. BPTC-684]
MPRMLRHGSSVGADLPPDEAVTVDAPDGPMGDALAAVHAGDRGPAAALLAGTRERAEWERRSTYVTQLAAAALHSPGWLDAWLAESPEDPDAVLVKAELCVHQAWEIRSAARARDVAPEQFQAFFALLGDAVPVASAAARLNPTDPVPWQIALTHARGSQASREVFDAYWAEAVARSPHHYGCHAAALQYLSEKWYGSHGEMFAFAERAAESALPGSKLHALPLLAAVEYVVVSDDPRQSPVERARIDAAVERGLELSTWYEPGDPDAADFRNHLVLMLILHERWAEALDVFRAIGVRARTYPWAYLGEPHTEFVELRSGVRMQLASRTPLFSRAGRAGVPGPAESAGSATASGDARALSLRSLAIAAAPPHEVAEAALMCGVSLRIAPAPPGMSYVELVPDPSPGRRAALARDDRLSAAADSFTTGEKWAALVLRRTGPRYGLTLLQKGTETAAHQWDPAAPVTDHAAASATAQALAAAFSVADARPLVALLRGADSPARRQADLVAALGLPPLPPGFGEHDEVLRTVPGAQLLARRGVLRGIRDSLSTDLGTPAIPVPRPRRWWRLRVAALTVLVPASAYAWTTPDCYRATIPTLASLFLASQLRTAWRARGSSAAR